MRLQNTVSNSVTQFAINVHTFLVCWYNAFNVNRRELGPGTVSLTGDRAQGNDSKHWAYSNYIAETQILNGRVCFHVKDITSERGYS